MAFSVGKMGGFGVANVYSTVSYLIITAICYAFISGGVFEITLGSILVFVVGLVLTNVLNMNIYGAIRSEAKLGKTIESSVKGGYRKTIMTVVDVYAVLTLGAVALLIGVAGKYVCIAGIDLYRNGCILQFVVDESNQRNASFRKQGQV
jgi:preprotein translocase subunit SecD